MMEKYFRPVQPNADTGGHSVSRPDVQNNQEKGYKHRQMVSPNSHHKKHHGPVGSEIHRTCSSAEESRFTHHHHYNRSFHQHDCERADHAHSRNYHHKQKCFPERIVHPPVSGSSSSSSTASSSSSSSSPSSSSSSSYSLSSSTSTSLLSSEASVEYCQKHPLKKHSQSCTDIFQEENDTTPLIGEEVHGTRLSVREKHERGASPRSRPVTGTLKSEQRVTRGPGITRKAKSMEALSRDGKENEEELGSKKNETNKNLVKEKLKFSAFLNEITRQVLSPMRLTTLGVTDAHSSSGRASVRSVTSRTQRSQPGSADSTASSNRTHTSKHSRSSRRPRSEHGKRTNHHHGHNGDHGSPHVHHTPKSCSDIRDSPEITPSHRRHSWSPKRHSHSPVHHHHGEHHHHHKGRRSPCHHIHQSKHHHRHSYRPGHCHGDHHNLVHHHHHRDPHDQKHHHHHGDHPNPSSHHHHGDHHSQGHHHHHGDHHRATHHHGGHNVPIHHHHPRDQGHHGDHQSSSHHHRHCEQSPTRHHHSQTHHHHHHQGDHHSQTHHHHKGDHHSRTHHHGEHHSSTPHHGDQQNPTPLHGDHHAHTNHHGHNESPTHLGHHSSTHHHGDYHSAVHRQGDGSESLHSVSHSKKSDQESYNEAVPKVHHHSGHLESDLQQHQHDSDHLHHISHQSHHSPTQSEPHHSHPSSHHHNPTQGQSHPHSHHHDSHHSGLPSDRKLASHSSTPGSSKNGTSSSSPEEDRTSYRGSASLLQKNEAGERDRIMILQEQNVGLQHSLLQSAVRMECLGEEFMSSQQVLETELQKTRIELSNLTQKFNKLQENYSSTQQTNNLLEQKLNSVAQVMNGERERLNQRISVLTKQLTSAKPDSVEMHNVASGLHNPPEPHFQTDPSTGQFVVPVAPPPSQFMDGHNFVTVKEGQDLSLGSVPEEEESDWSETGDETPLFILKGSNRGPSKHGAFSAWRPEHRSWEGQVEADIDSESGGEESVRLHPSHPLKIPHLQFTIHREILAIPQTDAGHGMVTGEGGYRVSSAQRLGSLIRIRSASLEEIPTACHHMQEELRGTEAMMDLHHPEDEAIDDSDNEIIHHWRTTKDSDTAVATLMGSREPERDRSLAGLQSAQRMLNHFICDLQPSVGDGQERAQIQGWVGGLPEEVLKGERTQM